MVVICKVDLKTREGRCGHHRKGECCRPPGVDPRKSAGRYPGLDARIMPDIGPLARARTKRVLKQKLTDLFGQKFGKVV